MFSFIFVIGVELHWMYEMILWIWLFLVKDDEDIWPIYMYIYTKNYTSIIWTIVYVSYYDIVDRRIMICFPVMKMVVPTFCGNEEVHDL